MPVGVVKLNSDVKIHVNGSHFLMLEFVVMFPCPIGILSEGCQILKDPWFSYVIVSFVREYGVLFCEPWNTEVPANGSLVFHGLMDKGIEMQRVTTDAGIRITLLVVSPLLDGLIDSAWCGCLLAIVCSELGSCLYWYDCFFGQTCTWSTVSVSAWQAAGQSLHDSLWAADW